MTFIHSVYNYYPDPVLTINDCCTLLNAINGAGRKRRNPFSHELFDVPKVTQTGETYSPARYHCRIKFDFFEKNLEHFPDLFDKILF